jgi:hypothetical protein
VALIGTYAGGLVVVSAVATYGLSVMSSLVEAYGGCVVITRGGT